jgi:ArsR family transcriptional regulator, arsenate/arsenite/antimonite-responsive transcriptional repressor
MDLECQAKIFKALGDPTRLRIMRLLFGGELCVCEIIPETGKSQPTTSAHLKILREAGLIKSRKDGLSVYCRLADESIKKIIKDTEKIK